MSVKKYSNAFFFFKVPQSDTNEQDIMVTAFLNARTVTWMHTGTAYVNSQTAYFQRTSCRDVDGCSAMEKNAAEEEDEREREVGISWIFRREKSGFEWKRVIERRVDKTVAQWDGEGETRIRNSIFIPEANGGCAWTYRAVIWRWKKEEGNDRNFMAICYILTISWQWF